MAAGQISLGSLAHRAIAALTIQRAPIPAKAMMRRSLAAASGSVGPTDSRHWLERERVLLYPTLSLLAAFLILLGIWTARSLPGLIDPAGEPVGNDFIGFWSAARL